MYTRYFAEELQKIAMLKAPKITTSMASITAKSGAGMKVPAPSIPAVKSSVSLGGKLGVPTASGKNLGTKVSPRTKTVPNAIYGGSLVR